MNDSQPSLNDNTVMTLVYVFYLTQYFLPCVEDTYLAIVIKHACLENNKVDEK